jgi:hypothetical protein
MRLAVSFAAALALAGLFLGGARAADKEVTLKGTILCAKCALNETKKCTTAIKVKEGGKDVVYYFLDRGAKEDYHEEVCGGGQKEGTVTGVVSEKDGKKWVTPKKGGVEYAK